MRRGRGAREDELLEDEFADGSLTDAEAVDVVVAAFVVVTAEGAALATPVVGTVNGGTSDGVGGRRRAAAARRRGRTENAQAAECSNGDSSGYVGGWRWGARTLSRWDPFACRSAGSR